MTVTKNLGLVRAIHVGTTSPSNLNMVWYDDNLGQKKHKYYDTITSTWLPFAATNNIWELNGTDIQTHTSLPGSPNLLPRVTLTQDLGSSTKRWKDTYIGSSLDFDTTLSIKNLGVEKFKFDGDKLVIGNTSATAYLDLRAGTTTLAPLRIRQSASLLTTPLDGTFEFNGTSLYFTRAGVRNDLLSTSSTLASLTDVQILSPLNNQILRYNTGLGKWQNTNGMSGTGTANRGAMWTTGTTVGDAPILFTGANMTSVGNGNLGSGASPWQSLFLNSNINSPNTINYAINGSTRFKMKDDGMFIIGSTTTENAFLQIKPGTTTIASIKLDSGVLLSSITNGTFEYNGTTLFFSAGGVRHDLLTGGGASTLNDLTDVIISSPALNQVLQYNGTNWVNATLASGGITTLNTLTATTQTFAVGTTGTDFAISSATSTHTFNLPTASAANRGALSSADWSTFNSKATVSGTTGKLAKITGTSTLGDSIITELTGKIGVNEATPTADLDIRASSGSFADIGFRVKNSSGTALIQVANNADIGMGTAGAVPLNGSGISMYGAASTSNYIAGFYSGGVAAMIVRGHGTLGGSVGVGTNPPAADTRLHTKGFGNTSATWSFLAQNSTGSDVVSISDNRNLIIGGVTADDGVNCLTIYNGVAPSGLVNTAQFYALAGEMYVKDSAGNQTQLSPHDKDGYWIYNSKNDRTGKGVRIHMEKLMKKISQVYGEEFFEEFTI